MNKFDQQTDNSKLYERIPFFTVKDLAILAFYVLIAPLSWIAPARIWKILSFIIGFVVALLHVKRTVSRTKRILNVCAKTWKNIKYSLLEIKIISGSIEPHFQYFREYRFGGWRKPIKLTGREHIDKALEYGNGCILWVCPCLYGNLVEKKGLYQAGFAVHHLGSYAHGPSRSRFGLRFLNPIWTVIEKRYLAGRITIPFEKNLTYIRRVEWLLRQNGLISISCEPNFDQKRLDTPILNGNIQLATGAPSFALSTRATLLPVFTICKRNYDFEIIVEPPLNLPNVRNRHEAVEILIHQYAKLLESYMVRFTNITYLWRSISSYSNKINHKEFNN